MLKIEGIQKRVEEEEFVIAKSFKLGVSTEEVIFLILERLQVKRKKSEIKIKKCYNLIRLKFSLISYINSNLLLGLT